MCWILVFLEDTLYGGQHSPVIFEVKFGAFLQYQRLCLVEQFSHWGPRQSCLHFLAVNFALARMGLADVSAGSLGLIKHLVTVWALKLLLNQSLFVFANFFL